MINCAFENHDTATLRHVVVDSLVLSDGKILLVKRVAKLLEGGKWGLVGGFVERDETLAQAAEREVMEETGWQIKNLRLLKINDSPDRPGEDRQNISFVYYCEATKKTGSADRESDEQAWFDLNKLPNKEDIAFDGAQNIEALKKHLKNTRKQST